MALSFSEDPLDDLAASNSASELADLDVLSVEESHVALDPSGNPLAPGISSTPIAIDVSQDFDLSSNGLFSILPTPGLIPAVGQAPLPVPPFSFSPATTSSPMRSPLPSLVNHPCPFDVFRLMRKWQCRL
ncbi:hypothetical protein ACA910_013715 [Epithemia clementina (nom. ined.)]